MADKQILKEWGKMAKKHKTSMFCLLFKCVFLCEHFICGNEMVLIKQMRSLLLYMWHDIWNLSSVKCLWKSYQRRCTFLPSHLRFDLFRRHMTVAKKTYLHMVSLMFVFLSHGSYASAEVYSKWMIHQPFVPANWHQTRV